MTILIERDTKNYMLGYRDGVERAAEQCRFYAEKELDWRVTHVTEELEELILMLRDHDIKYAGPGTPYSGPVNIEDWIDD